MVHYLLLSKSMMKKGKLSKPAWNGFCRKAEIASSVRILKVINSEDLPVERSMEFFFYLFISILQFVQ